MAAIELSFGFFLSDPLAAFAGFSDSAAAAAQATGDVHQAARVGSHDHVGAALLDRLGLVAHHRAADATETHRKRPAEAAALVEALQRDQLQARDVPEELLRLGLESQAAQVTRHVIGCLAVKAGADVKNAEHVDEKIGQLVGPRRQLNSALVPDQVVGAQDRAAQ